MNAKVTPRSEAEQIADRFIRCGGGMALVLPLLWFYPIRVYLYLGLLSSVLPGLTVLLAGYTMRYLARKPVASTRVAQLAALLFLSLAAVSVYIYARSYYTLDSFALPVCGASFAGFLYYFSRFLPEPYEVEVVQKQLREAREKRLAEAERAREAERRRIAWEAGEPARQAQAESDKRKAQEALERVARDKEERERQALEAARQLPSSEW